MNSVIDYRMAAMLISPIYTHTQTSRSFVYLKRNRLHIQLGKMSKVPAWKRLGLSVKKDVEDDALNTTSHLGDETVTNKIAKKLNKKRSKGSDDASKKEKKPPKRQKLPKSERKPPPEKDQLAYLKQFSEDKDNWKFSKQKQNWLLKNIEHIPSVYESALKQYIDSIQGGARSRVESQLREVVDKWNEVAKKLEEKIEAELFSNKKSEDDKEEKDDEKTNDDKSSKETEEKEDKGPSRDYAIRCKTLLDVLVDEPVTLVGIEESVVDTIDIDELTGGSTGIDDEPVEQKAKDNLIIEEIEVEEYVNQALK